jgi:Tfp pilus assembly protein PilF
MRHGHPEEARKIFQQGIWACAQLAGTQSGGYHCARLWQAWGVLEAREEDHAAARRCFSRALDADSRNVATVTAWTQMEEDLGNNDEARALFERSLKNYAPGSDAKMVLWRAYELMEQRAGNVDAAQQVYQRSVRETFNVQDDRTFVLDDKATDSAPGKDPEKRRSKYEEVEVSRWGGLSSMRGEVWMKDGAIETKMPKKAMEKNRTR